MLPVTGAFEELRVTALQKKGGRTVGNRYLLAATWLAAALVGWGPGYASLAGAEPLEHQVTIGEGGFTPREETVRQGDTVVWTHADPGDFHSVTADEGWFDSHPGCSKDATDRCMEEGDRYSVHFLSAGRFPYHCKVHGESGLIMVVAGD